MRKSDMKWKWIVFERAKSHCVPEKIAQGIIEDMERRDHKMLSIEDTKFFVLDPGGMLFLKAPYERFSLAGLRIECQSGHVELFTEMARRRMKVKDERDAGGVKYVKMHGAYHCIVVPSDILPRFAKMLERREKAADERDAAWFKSLKPIGAVKADWNKGES